MDITKFAIPEIIFGRGSLNHAGQCALRLGAKKVFLVSDEGIERPGGCSA
jgi:alcohol dehydrogenase